MKTAKLATAFLVLALTGGLLAPAARAQDEIPFTDTFFLEDCHLGPRGVNNYFIPLQPGCFLLLKGEEDEETLTVFITVLHQTKVVDGVRCAIVLEVEWEGDELVEVSSNYIAICRKCNDVFYFGEDVDDYEDGEIVGHSGAWLAGVNGAKPGLLMPGRPLNGSRYFQEVAPGVALDRAEHLSNTTTVETEAGTFENCLTVGETTPLEPDEFSLKAYARGIGMVQDDNLTLVKHGCRRFGFFPRHDRGDGDEDDD